MPVRSLMASTRPVSTTDAGSNEGVLGSAVSIRWMGS